MGKQQAHDDRTLKGILTGRIFEEQFLVERFVEDDFFHWVAGADHFSNLKPMFREINRQIAEYDFSDVKEDILKGVYQELIDLDTRHALGEYYTPDWLCERVIEALPIERQSTLLDPACGSGSFLRAAIARARREHPRLTAEELCSQICGIDIHPLSVQIAKTTVLLSLADLIAKAKRPVTLHVYLANSLLVPEQSADLFKSTFQMSIDNRAYEVNVTGSMSQEQFDQLITICDDLVSDYDDLLEKQRFIALTRRNLPSSYDHALPDQLYDVYQALKNAKNSGRDSIWKFILQNSYKPVFLKERFDFVVGNPPWLTYAAISNAEYQSEIKRLADVYRVTPANKANMPHLEIAAVFLAHSANYFLKPSGTISFVLPRSFMSADQHDPTRSGTTVGLKLKAVWDLKDVAPLFRVPSCVFFAVRAPARRTENPIPASGLEGLTFSGRLPRAQIHWEEVRDRICTTGTRWYYSQLAAGNRRAKSALTQSPGEALLGNNAYADNFKQGATVVPRSFYFVDVDEPDGEQLSGRVLNLQPSASMLKEAKDPWKAHPISGRLEGEYLFRTAVSKNVLPFALVRPLFVALPVAIEGSEGSRSFTVLGHGAIRARGARFAGRWFSQAEQLWNRLRTEKATEGGMSYLDRLDYQRGISDQDPQARFLVLYTGSANDANAAVVDRQRYAAPFVVEHKTYWFQTKSQREAHYVCAYLNSGYANEKIKDFQSRGLFGPRDVHKTILKLPFPKFDRNNEVHKALATLGAQAAERADRILGAGRNSDYDARNLGRKRTVIRTELDDLLAEIDVIVEQLSSGRTESAIRASGKGRPRRRRKSLPLFD